MTLKEFYTEIEGDYEDAVRRLMSERLVSKFVLKFLNDKSCEELFAAYEAGDGARAFRAAHTIKGVAQNLSFTKLYESSHELAEQLRGGVIRGDEGELLAAVRREYERTIEAIRAFQAEASLEERLKGENS